jgi:transposase InsO family protein
LLSDRSNQVWYTDITYIPMRRGLLYLVTVTDWFSRKVQSWRVSNTMETDFCIAAVACVFRRLQPSIPIETSHLFRSKPAGDSDDPSRVAARVVSG